MSKRSKKKIPRAARKKLANGYAGVEWVGGSAVLPTFVEETPGQPYRPLAVTWMTTRGRREPGVVLGVEIVEPSRLEATLLALFRAAVEKPMTGRAHEPNRVRVATPELAELLRRELEPTIEVVCGSTPEVELALGLLARRMGEEGDDEEDSFLGGDIEPNAMAAFFRAAASLYRACPWKLLPSDETVYRLDIEVLGLTDAVACVVGQLNSSPALLVFPNAAAFGLYLQAAADVARGWRPTLPPHVALCFERRADMPPPMLAEIEAQGWEVAGNTGYPSPSIIDPDLIARGPTALELRRLEAIALAVAELVQQMAHAQTPDTQWSGVVQTLAGPVEVTLSLWDDLDGD